MLLITQKGKASVVYCEVALHEIYPPSTILITGLPLKCPFDFDLYLKFRVELDFVTRLAKFQSPTNIRNHYILIVSELGGEWEKVMSKAQHTSRVCLTVKNHIKTVLTLIGSAYFLAKIRGQI